MRTWNYKGNQNGFQTHIQRHPGGDIVIFQTLDGGDKMAGTHPVVAVVFNEAKLLAILKDKKRFPRAKKSKRGKK
jgi:hypothetical protein